MPSLKAFKRMAGLPDGIRRWAEAAEHVKAGQQALASQKGAKVSDNAVWHPSVAKELAIQDGLGPADFQWAQWPVSNVRIENSQSRHYPFYLRCDMPAGTPVDNQYVEDAKEPTGWRKLPDPVGICLQRVEFTLRDADTHDELTQDGALLSEGVAQGKPADRSELWRRLTPGTALKVRLYARPLFYYLKADGAAMLAYAIGNNQHFAGGDQESPVYTLTMDHDGGVSVA